MSNQSTTQPQLLVTYRCSRWEPGRTCTWLPNSREWLEWVQLRAQHIRDIEILSVETVEGESW